MGGGLRPENIRQGPDQRFLAFALDQPGYRKDDSPVSNSFRPDFFVIAAKGKSLQVDAVVDDVNLALIYLVFGDQLALAEQTYRNHAMGVMQKISPQSGQKIIRVLGNLLAVRVD